MNDPLVWARALHFAVTTMMAGVAIFTVLVSEPAFGNAKESGLVATTVRRRLAAISWISLALVAISAVAWLALVAQQMSERPLIAVFMEGPVWTVLSRSGFGHAWAARSVLTVVLAAWLLGCTCLQVGALRMWTLAALLGACIAASLAWSGHAAAGSDAGGLVHLSADILHLVAAAAWVGALVPLAVLLATAQRQGDAISSMIACGAVSRFSRLGIVSVGILLATGTVNTWVLAGSVPALLGTDYGRLLLFKIALFLLMLSIAAVNRQRLSPRLLHEPLSSAGQGALRQLRINSLIEASAGAMILIIVGLIGTLPPGTHEDAAAPPASRTAAIDRSGLHAF